MHEVIFMILVLSFMVCNTVAKIRPQLLKSLTSVVIMVIIIRVVFQDLRMKTKSQGFVVATLTVFVYLRKVECKGDVAG